MKKMAATISAITITLAVIFIVWLRAGIVSTEWAVELVGGKKILALNIETTGEDAVFARSMDPTPNTAEATAILSDTSCHLPNESCLNTNLAIANTLVTARQDLARAKFFLDLYSSISTERCPIKPEVSQLIYQTAFLIANPDESAARKLLNKIRNSGGIAHSIATQDCRDYLASRPYLSKAYLYYLATLMALANYPPDSAPIYLIYMSEYENNRG